MRKMSEFYSPEQFFYSLPKYAKYVSANLQIQFIFPGIVKNLRSSGSTWSNQKQKQKKRFYVLEGRLLYSHIVNVVICGKWDGKSQHLHWSRTPYWFNCLTLLMLNRLIVTLITSCLFENIFTGIQFNYKKENPQKLKHFENQEMLNLVIVFIRHRQSKKILKTRSVRASKNNVQKQKVVKRKQFSWVYKHLLAMTCTCVTFL